LREVTKKKLVSSESHGPQRLENLTATKKSQEEKGKGKSRRWKGVGSTEKERERTKYGTLKQGSGEKFMPELEAPERGCPAKQDWRLKKKESQKGGGGG